MNLTDVMYGMRNMACHAADKLRIEIENAQKILDELDQFANDAEDGAQLIAASDIEPRASALIPERANMHHGRPDSGWKAGDTAQYCGMIDGKHLYIGGAAHQAEMNGEKPVETGFPAGPRTVMVVHELPRFHSPSLEYVRYGRAITGRPISKATIINAPRNNSDREWLSTCLPAYIAPDGEIIHAYKGGVDGSDGNAGPTGTPE